MAAKFPESVQVSDETDWDFYCDYSKEKINMIEDRGFELDERTNPEYFDDLLKSIYRKGNIQVLIRYDARQYQRAFDLISEDMFYNYIWKSSPVFQEKTFDPNKVCQFMNALFGLVK